MSNPSGFDLRITFTGLCLLVKDTRDASHPKMHALLLAPDRRPSNAHQMEHHFADIYHDSAYTIPNSTRVSGNYASFPIRGLLDLSTLPSDPRTSAHGRPADIPKEVADLNAVSGCKIDKSCIGTDFDGEIAARVTIGSGHVSDYNVSGPWQFQGSDDCYLAWKAGWLIPCSGMDHLDVWDGSTIRTLYPIGGLIELRVKNVVESERMGEDPPFMWPNQTSQRHFMAYFDVYPSECRMGVPTAPPLPDGTVEIRGSFMTCAIATGSVSD